MTASFQHDAPSIFLCYAREDFDRINKLYTLLKNLGLRPWLDQYDITAGQLWQIAIETAVKHSDFFIASFSSVSVQKSGYIQREYRFALDTLMEKPPGKIFLIPVRLDQCELPDLRGVGIKLSDVQWVDLFQTGPLTEKDVEPILRAIEAQSGWRRPESGVSEIVTSYIDNLDEEILETLRVRDLPSTDKILHLKSLANTADLRRLEKHAYDQYLSSQSFGVYQPLETSYLIARFLYRAILDNDFAVFRQKPFVYSIHQYLSRLIKDSSAPDRLSAVATLRRWLSSKETYETARDFAAFELGMSKASEATPLLLEVLDDPFELPLVRYYAAMALGMIGSRDVMPQLVRIHHREPDPQMRDLVGHVIVYLAKFVS